MKRMNLKRVHVSKEWVRNHLSVPFKKSFQVINGESSPTSDSHVSVKELSAVCLAYDERQRLDAQMLEMGIRKAEAFKSARERTRLT